MSSTYFYSVLNGGLGNVLFQLASIYGLSKTFNVQFAVHLGWYKKSYHSSINYFSGLLAEWTKFHRPLTRTDQIISIQERMLYPIEGNILKKNHVHIFNGYYQNYTMFDKYKPEILSMIRFSTTVAEKYPLLKDSAFIHVRGGDYIGNNVNFVDLTEYYNRAIESLQCEHYYVFTNDKQFLSKQPWLSNIQYTVVEENEIDSLYLMSQCAKGAICANSTFSWWGAYLNCDRPIYMPGKWFQDPNFYVAGFYFPGVTVIAV